MKMFNRSLHKERCGGTRFEFGNCAKYCIFAFQTPSCKKQVPIEPKWKQLWKYHVKIYVTAKQSTKIYFVFFTFASHKILFQ